MCAASLVGAATCSDSSDSTLRGALVVGHNRSGGSVVSGATGAVSSYSLGVPVALVAVGAALGAVGATEGVVVDARATEVVEAVRGNVGVGE